MPLEGSATPHELRPRVLDPACEQLSAYRTAVPTAGALVDCDAHCRVAAGETPALSCRPLDRSAWWRVGVVQDLGERQRALAALSRLQVVRVVQAFVGKVDQVDASLPPF